MPNTGYQRSRKGGTGTRRGSGRVRIIAGRLGGRRVQVPDAPGLRPTPERTRETLFNWLQGRLDGARILDLFAGSGILAFEALSRGAALAVLVERDPRVAAQLRASADELGLVHDANRDRDPDPDPDASADGAPAEARIVRGDALTWLERADPRAGFDLVLLDPPFSAQLARPALALLAAGTLLDAEARIYCEWAAADPEPWDAASYEVLREARAGDSRAALLCRRSPADPGP
ncbi:MAG TPA: 16S rRNA (guanine(966)-N(2))-methyltransferase RsmD [Pseudomonadales bacterium]|nr:16S rRNA (guanine(966)-N(2))-methyltransferase RsmD [Pseudomonadales bacterium]